jgi:ring-1,2-phenylacetyl-CoA epoxidase subunit PaaA
MPEAYRKTLIRQISQHAHSEYVGMLPESNWITRAPTLKRKAILLAKVQDEAGHGLYLYSAAETLGVTRDQTYLQLHLGQGQVLQHLQLPDADLGRHRRHRLAGRRLGHRQPDTAVPLLLRPLCARHGARLQGRVLPPAPGLRHHDDAVPGTPEQKAMAQDALNRWWWPSLMMFGPSDEQSVNSAQSMAWKIKQNSNDELRQRFIDQTVPQIEFLGLDRSRPESGLERGTRPLRLRRDRLEKSSLRSSKGKGPCNRSASPRATRPGTTAPGSARR